MDPCQRNSITDIFNHRNVPCVVDSYPGIQMSGGSVLELFRSEYNIDDWERSYSFSITENQRFAIEGRVGEYDTHHGTSTYHWLYFGGLDGIPAKKDGSQVIAVFEGADVKSQTVEFLTFEYAHPDWNSISDPFFFLHQTSPASGSLEAMYVVE